MNTIDFTLHARDALELVAQLRAIAEKIEQHGSDELPTAGASKRIYHEGELAGEMSAPAVMRLDDNEFDEDVVFLTTRDVIAKTGLASTTLQRRRENDPTFPKPVVLSRSSSQPRCIRWVKPEIERWMRAQMQRREGDAGNAAKGGE